MNAAVPDRFDAFRAAYEFGRGALVWRHDIADLLTPVAAFLKAAHGKPFSFLLESVEGGAARGRYSVIGMEPDLIWRCEKGEADHQSQRLRPTRRLSCPPARRRCKACALWSRRRGWTCRTQPAADGRRPVGYLGYDMVRLMEKLPATKPDVLGMPEGDPGPPRRCSSSSTT